MFGFFKYIAVLCEMKVKTKTKSNRGGVRAGSGAKPIDDPKIPVTFYVRKSIVYSYVNIGEFRNNYKDLFVLKEK